MFAYMNMWMWRECRSKSVAAIENNPGNRQVTGVENRWMHDGAGVSIDRQTGRETKMTAEYRDTRIHIDRD